MPKEKRNSTDIELRWQIVEWKTTKIKVQLIIVRIREIKRINPGNLVC